MMPYQTGDIITVEVVKVKDNSIIRFYKNGLVTTSGIEDFGRLDTTTYDWRLAVSFSGPGTVEIEDWDVLYQNPINVRDDWDRDSISRNPDTIKKQYGTGLEISGDYGVVTSSEGIVQIWKNTINEWNSCLLNTIPERYQYSDWNPMLINRSGI